MIQSVVFQGKKEFTAEYYSTEIKNRSYHAKDANGYYIGFGNELKSAIIGDNVFRVNSGLLLIQGRQCAIIAGTTEDVTIPLQSTSVQGYIIARMNTAVISGENVEITYKLGTAGALPSLVQEDTYNISSSQNATYELPLYSFTMYKTITNVKKLINPVHNAQIEVDSGTGSPSDYLCEDGLFVKKSGNQYLLYVKTSSGLKEIPLDSKTLGGMTAEDIVALAEEKVMGEITVNIDCDHEYEITGKTGHEYGVAIEDSQMLLKKIQGQTRRYSLNLFGYKFSETNAGITFRTDENGIITLNGTSTGSTLYRDSITIPAGEYTFAFVGNTNSEFKFTINQVGSFNSNIVQSCNYPNSTIFGFSINIPSGVVLNNLKLYPMLVLGTYTQDTMPAFQPYDDTLVNSKCNLISTGRNLLYYKTTNGTSNGLTYSFNGNIVRIKGTATADTAIYSDMNELLLNGSYYWKPNANKVNNMPCAILYNNTTIMDLNNSSDVLIELTNTKANRMLWYIPNGTTIDYEASIMLNYGNQPSEYEPYTQEELPIGIELAAYDYIDNVSHLLVRQTSNVITLDGSSDENWQIIPESPSKRFQITNLLSDPAAPNSTSTIIVSSNWINTSADNTFLNKNGVSVAGNDLHIYNENYVDDLDGFKAWLKSNPIQVSYKLATPTTEQLLLPAGYAVYTGGLQQQVIAEGKYLPYVLSKEYAVSIPSQVKVNIEIDRVQQEQLTQAYQLSMRLSYYAANYRTLRLEDWILKIKNVAGDGTFKCSLEKIKQYIDQSKLYQHTVLMNINNEVTGFITITNRSATPIANISGVIEFLSSNGFISVSTTNYTFYPMMGKLSSGSSQIDLLGIFTFSSKDSVAVAYLDSSNAVKRSMTYFTYNSTVTVRDTVVAI